LAVPVHPVSDSHVYDVLARNLANGFGYCFIPGRPTALWAVGTPFIYSIFYRIFGPNYQPIVVFNLVLSLATIWISMLLAERWFDRRVAIVAGYFFACWPVLIEFTSCLASELIFNFLIVALLLLWDSPRLNPWLRAIAVGLLAGAAVYVRPVALFIPAILGVLSSVRAFRDRKSYLLPLAMAAVACTLMALTIAPWSLRNKHVFGHVVMMSTNGGGDWWMGNNPGGPGKEQLIPVDILRMPEGDRDVHLGNLAKAYIRQYPGRFVIRTLRKAFWLYDHETIGVHWNLPVLQNTYGIRGVTVLKLVSDLYWWIMLLLGLSGACLLFARLRIGAFYDSPLIALWAFFTAFYAMILINDRYHMCCIPPIGILAAFAVTGLYQRMRSRAKRQLA
jgi:4-amino-4-deoxy-L-arabinose transferase-like glycosyltransferase